MNTTNRRQIEKLRFEKVMMGKESGEKNVSERQKILAARLYELRKEPFRIRQEVAGLPKSKQRDERPGRSLDGLASLGDHVLKDSEDASYRLPLTTLLEGVRKGGSKERAEFISKRMSALSGDQGQLISFVRSNITGLLSTQLEKIREPIPDREPYITLFDFPGRHQTKYFTPLHNHASKTSNQDRVSENERNKNSTSESLWSYPRYQDVFRKDFGLKECSLGFCMVGDFHRAVRDYMRSIGWHEKFSSQDERGVVTRALQRPTSKENKEAAQVFNQVPVKFIWVNGYINWTCVRPGVIVSRIPSTNAYFSKTSLSTALKDQLRFIFEKGEVDAKIPRTFEVRGDGDLKHFSKQFRITACVCLLKKFYVDMSKDDKTIADTDGTVPIDCVDFAVKRLVELIRFTEHADIDDWCFSVVHDEDWDLFLLRFYDIVHYDAKFQIKTNGINVTKLLIACQKMLDHIYRYQPEMRYEGTRNLWICKPANGSCGRGVRVLRKLEDIQSYCKANNCYVIQKYIELPLLIYNTKFDIRQWFVITSVSPLVIWMYNECYLRFCSQEFSLKNLHESVHLCNNTIQWKYKNGVRSPKLPNDNMWDNNTFADFLRKELKTDQWLNIQDQMRQAIIAACIATQEKMFHRSNSFHLYGADFMLTPDFQVWLIEINCQPSMKYSTTVTSRMCKAVLEDTIKVGLERSLNPSAPVGKFREIYRQSKEPAQAILPFGGIIHSRRARILQRRPYPFIPSGETTNRSNRQKWISYEEIANYKRHSMLSVKPDVKTNQPLDPGDSTSCTSTSSVVINDSSSTETAKNNSEKKCELKSTQTQTTKAEVKKKAQTNEESDPDKDHQLNKSKEKMNSTSQTKKTNNKNTRSEVTISEDKPKKKGSTAINTGNYIMLSKDDLLGKLSELPKDVVDIAKRALANKNINARPISPKSRISLASKWKKQGMQLVLVPNEGDEGDVMNIEKSNDSKKPDGKQDDSSSALINGEIREVYLYENNSDPEIGDDDASVVNDNSKKENTGDGPAKSPNSSCVELLYDILEDKGNELDRENSGFTIIGESAADRKLEDILNSTKYLNAIGKAEEKVAPTFKSIVRRRRDYCE